MIVDNKGNLFENRRKPNSDRRKNEKKVNADKRKGERRKNTSSDKKR